MKGRKIIFTTRLLTQICSHQIAIYTRRTRKRWWTIGSQAYSCLLEMVVWFLGRTMSNKMICERMRWVPIQKLLCHLNDEPGWTYPDKILLSWHSYNVVTIYAVWMKNSYFNAFYEKWFLVCYLELLLYCSTFSVTKVFWFNKMYEDMNCNVFKWLCFT